MYKLLFIALLFSAHTNAAYTGNQTITKFYGSKYIEFAVSNPPANTCSYFGYHFRFDASTEAGKNLLSILLSAKLAGKSVSVWYNDSTAIGTDETNGCNGNTLAKVSSLGFN